MAIESWDLRTLTPDQAHAVGELIAAVWPKPHLTAADRAENLLATGRQYQGPSAQAPRSFVVIEDGRIVAHAGVTPRRLKSSAGEMTVAGLSRVCTGPAMRGRGLGELVAQTALAAVDAGDFPFALFQTSERVQPFYEKLGAAIVDNRFVNSLAEDPTANPFWDRVIMRYPATGDWPAGTIDLCGPGY